MSESVWVRCRCGHWVLLTVLLEHMYARHGVNAEFEQWPDGEVVIYDDTLQPSDFTDADL